MEINVEDMHCNWRKDGRLKTDEGQEGGEISTLGL